jgi:hypothetical protein
VAKLWPIFAGRLHLATSALTIGIAMTCAFGAASLFINPTNPSAWHFRNSESATLLVKRKLKICQEVWDDIETQAQLVAADYRDKQLFELERAIALHQSNQTSLAVVGEILAASRCPEGRASLQRTVN